MAGLPRLITLFSNGRFFEYESQEGYYHATVRRSSNTIVSENNFTLFEVERARVSGMIHIKSLYNNRYLRLNSSRMYIGAIADEVEEDRTKPTCTLFRFQIVNSNTHSVRFSHLSDNFERAVIVYRADARGDILGGSTRLPSSFPQSFLFTFRDMTNHVMLPKHVMFRGNDGNYLRARQNRNLVFVANDPTDPRVHHTSNMEPRTGNFSFMSNRFNLYWQRINGDWLQCTSNTPHADNTVFRPVRQSFGTQTSAIALFNTHNSRYCERWTSGGNAGRIRASSMTIPPTALLTVEEAVRDRQISDIRYRLDDARIFNMVPLQSLSQIVYNYGHHDERQNVSFTYREVVEEKFTSSHSWKLTVRTTVRVRLIPVILSGQLTTTASYGGSVEWSKKRTVERIATGSTTATVPARSSTRVTLIVGQGSMDVPYSYKQSDILMDGRFEEKIMHDGLFSGLNTFEFQYIIEEPQSLPTNARSPTGQDDIVVVPGESMDLPRTIVSCVIDEPNVEGIKEEEPVPIMEEEDLGGEGNEEPLPHEVPLPMPSKL